MSTRELGFGLAGIVIGAAAFGWVFKVGYDMAEGTGRAQLETAARDCTIAQDKQAAVAHARWASEVARANQLDRDLAGVRDQLAHEKQLRKARINHVTTVYIPASAPASAMPLPRCVFTAGFLYDLNAAFATGQLPGSHAAAIASHAGRATEAAADPRAELRESGLTQADLLAWAGDAGTQCRQWASQVNKLIDLLEPQ